MELLFTNKDKKTIKESIFNLVQDKKIKRLSIVIAYHSYGDTTHQFWETIQNLSIPIDFYFLCDKQYVIDPKILEYTKDKENIIWYLMSTGFHAKLIYGEKVGIYIGSANMTESALNSNFEVGVYEDCKNIDKNSINDYLSLLQKNAKFVVRSNQNKNEKYQDIVECYYEYKSNIPQSNKYNNLMDKYFPKPNNNTSYDIDNSKYSKYQKELGDFFTIMFDKVYPAIDKRWKELPEELQSKEFTWVVDQILYNMTDKGCDTIGKAIESTHRYVKDHLKVIKKYKSGYKVIKQRKFSKTNKEALIQLAESSYAIITRPHMKQETKFDSYVTSWLKGGKTKKYNFEEIMLYFLDSDTNDIVERFYKLCNYRSDYKVENLNIGSLGDILGMALLKHPKYNKCYPISNNKIQKLVRDLKF